MKIARSLQSVTTLTVFDLQNSNISYEAADDIATVLTHNTQLQQLYLGRNHLQTEVAIKIAKVLLGVTTLTVFDIESSNINDKNADSIAAIIN